MLNRQFKIWLSPPHLNGTEIDHIRRAFDQNWISPYGENVDTFESQLEDYFQVPDVALTSSGTAAIHLALILAGVQQDDEVIVPTLNFAGCVNPILYQKAIPIFVDSDADSWNMDPDLARQVIVERIKLGRKPKAILAVDLFGVPCRLEKFEALAEEFGITLIEDAADAIGSRYKDKPLGSFGRMGIISFNGNKVVTTSGGGALISNDSELIRQAKVLSNQARSSAPDYMHRSVGYNYMMSNVLAGIGRGQMQVLQQRVDRRRVINENYRQTLADIPGLTFYKEIEGAYANCWLSVMLVDKSKAGFTRDEVLQALDREDIECRTVWRPMHLQPAFSAFPVYQNGTAVRLHEDGICLPSGSLMTLEQQNEVIACISRLAGR